MYDGRLTRHQLCAYTRQLEMQAQSMPASTGDGHMLPNFQHLWTQEYFLRRYRPLAIRVLQTEKFLLDPKTSKSSAARKRAQKERADICKGKCTAWLFLNP